MLCRFKVDTSFLAIGAAFPLSFGINVGFSRREKALAALASIKSSVVSLYWIHRYTQIHRLMMLLADALLGCTVQQRQPAGIC